ncbi:MAG TPA: HAMP domain-containing sensor histidine kinase [Caulobacterales bacterium]|nr:HAMP domain-containing sensor histidine kinase [Caulobacterales bacterium]
MAEKAHSNFWGLSDRQLEGAVGARRRTLVSRAVHNAAFALGVGLATQSWIIPATWYPLILLLMYCDVWAGEAFLAEREPDSRNVRRVIFVLAPVATIAAFMGLALTGAIYGGAAGKLVAALMATGSLVAVMAMMVDAPLFMVLCAAPGALMLGALPLLPPSGASPPIAIVGVYVTLIGCASHMVRIAVQHTALFRGITDAKEEAERRRAEAEEKRAEAEVHRREAERASLVKSEFLCAMTHELRTPLNAVINYAQMIAEDTDGVIAEDAARIDRSAKHLLGLIDRVLDYAMLDSERAGLELVSVNVPELVRGVVAAAMPLAQAHQNIISLDMRDDVIATADRARLAQCIECLVGNAVQFTRRGVIRISALNDRDLVRIRVQDSGVGLKSEEIARIFEAFAQSDGSKTRSAGGLGLGLAMARKIARVMGGDIIADGVEGKGACFELTLPLYASVAAA